MPERGEEFGPLENLWRGVQGSSHRHAGAGSFSHTLSIVRVHSRQFCKTTEYLSGGCYTKPATTS
jgi:hypothetical protein